jgi:hypothetical protein
MAVLKNANLVTTQGHDLIIPPIVEYELRRGLADERFKCLIFLFGEKWRKYITHFPSKAI